MKDKIMILLAVLFALPLQADDESNTHDSTDVELSSLTDYLTYALDHNAGLQAFDSRVAAANNRIPQAKSLPDPMFQVTHFVESVQTRTGPQENIFMLSQRFPWFGTLDGKEDAAIADAQAMAFAFWNQQITLVRRVSDAFFEYGYTGKAIELMGENLDLLTNLEPIVETRVQAGEDLNALLRLKVEIGKLEDRLASLKQKRVVQSSQLDALLNRPTEEVLAWPSWQPPEPVDLDEEQLARSLVEQNPDLQRLDQAVASAKARGRVAHSSSYPDFLLGVNYIQTGESVMNPDAPDSGEDPWSITAAVSIPLWAGKNKGARKEAMAQEQAAEDDKVNRALELKASLQSSIALLEDANRRLNLYGNELLGLAEQAVENSRASYEGGRVGILEMIDSERSLLDLQLIYWRAAADAWKERIAIQSLVESDPQAILNQLEGETTP